MDCEVNSDKIREQTEELIELLRKYHPEQEYEPEGLRIKDEPSTPQPAPAPAPVMTPRVRIAVPPSMRPIVKEICDKHDLPPELLLSRKRSPADLVMVRAEFYSRMRDLDWSFPKIARAVGRDHTTILYHVMQYRSAQQAALQ